MSDFIVSFQGIQFGREHERLVQAAIQQAVNAALAGLPAPDPENPEFLDFSSGAFYYPPRHWCGLIYVPAADVAALAEAANTTLTVTQKQVDRQ
jgi:hypothetical protein